MKSRNILIVEDELIIAKDLQRILATQSWNVSGICTKAEDAMEKIAVLPPDLVLIDIELRGKKDGIAIGRFLSTNTLIPFVYITSHTDRSTIEAVTSTLPSGYVVKPFRPEDIITTVEIVFARKDKNSSQEQFNEEKVLSEVPISLRKVAEHIQANLGEQLRIDELYKMTRWNKHQFIRNFKKFLDETPYQYILKSRIKKSKELLHKSEMPISQIAKSVGFQNHSSFSTAFLKLEKISADDFRRRMR